jgi:hypothetical protein
MDASSPEGDGRDVTNGDGAENKNARDCSRALVPKSDLVNQ